MDIVTDFPGLPFVAHARGFLDLPLYEHHASGRRLGRFQISRLWRVRVLEGPNYQQVKYYRAEAGLRHAVSDSVISYRSIPWQVGTGQSGIL